MRSDPRLARFLDAIDRGRVPAIDAIWIGGSIALGDVAPHSDLDVVVATAAPVPPAARVRVRGVDAEWLAVGELAAARGLVAVTRALGVRAGIAVRGPHPSAVFADVDHATLAAAMQTNIATYWQPWLARRGVSTLTCLHPRRAEWGIVGVPRQLVTIAEGRIVSKTAGARWLRDRVGARWHRILDEAIALRRGEPSRYRSPFARRRDMYAILAHAIELSACRFAG
jgi:aminoglycoside adenylyltransferase-like protein/nucleotidyltransferase-like protein